MNDLNKHLTIDYGDLLEELKQLKQENQNLKAKLNKSKRIVEITKQEENWFIRHFSKNYKGAVVDEQKINLPKENVINLWEIIKSLNTTETDKGEVVTKLIETQNLSYKDHREFSGNRKAYFELYYYPLLVLDYLKKVEYKRKIKVLK